jgi:eukaryotic-like serine/threonine-protein kinase
MDCPEENAIVDFVRGALPAEQRAAVESHVDRCQSCATVLAGLARLTTRRGGATHAASADDTWFADASEAAAPHRPTALAPGARLGRYELRRLIGAGGMGVVHAAHDPQLDRLVAIKILHDGGGSAGATSESARAHTRLLREAQAMAKLRHPNVVTVYDVGVHEDEQVFVAMELVQGQTLAAWLQAGPHDWREVLAVFRQAGEGLAAAHAAGLVHRDFKPANVMVEPSGHVRVMDFGLARAVAATPAAEIEEMELDTTTTSVSSRLTRTGSLVGTPAYMAPEQYAGAATDERTDQFSFCVALHEALHGARPFRASSIAALSMAVLQGRIEPPTEDRGVPKWLQAVVLRGLATAPEDRYPSMRELLDALSRDSGQRRRRWLVAGGATLLAGTAATLAFAAREDPCSGGDERIAMVWTAERADTIRHRFKSLSTPLADDTWARLEPRLEAYGRDWAVMHREACQATRRGMQSAELLDRRMSCLEQRLHRFDALVGLLEEVDAALVERAVEAVQTLGPLDRCADLDALMARLPPPEDPRVAAEVESIEAALARVEALEASGDYAGASEAAQPLLARALEVDHEPTQAMLRLRAGALQQRLDRYAEAAELLAAAYWQAAGAKDEHVAALAAAWMVLVVGHDEGRLEDARQWEQHGGAAIKRVGPGGSEEIELLTNLGVVALDRGDYETARDHHERALALRLDLEGESSVGAGNSMQNLGATLVKLGRYEESMAVQERAIEVLTDALGPLHPKVARARMNLGAVAYQLGRLDQARQHYELALETLEGALGSEHAHVADLLHNLSLVERKVGDLASARARAERSLAIFTTVYGAKHPRIAVARDNLGTILYMEGKAREARTEYQHALALRLELAPDNPNVATAHTNIANTHHHEGELELAREHYGNAVQIRERLLSPDHPELASALFNLGGVLVEMGEPRAAEEPLTRALAIRREALPPTHPSIARNLVALGNALAGQGRATEAVALIEEGLALLADTPDPSLRHDARFALARALWDTGDAARRARALTLARDLDAELKATPHPLLHRMHDQLATWLSERAD